VRLHTGRRSAAVALGDIGVGGTAYPFLLFLSQAETERILAEHLQRAGVVIERGVRLEEADLAATPPTCRLRHPDGRTETVAARYLVGCDGAHSTVRYQAGIEFRGAPYPQTFVLADLEVDGLHPGEVHAYLTGPGILFFFPLGAPSTWRMLAMRQAEHPDGEVSLDELHGIVAARTPDRLRLRDPVWMTGFRIHLRGASRYRAGSAFLAGDAAHIHSPAGGQGMNTGIQDAVNLGWKLGLVATGKADPAMLDTYETERAPVGRAVLRFTNRLFTLATTTNPVIRTVRTRLAPALVPLPLRSRAVRAAAFRVISQLAISYRHSPASVEGHRAPGVGRARETGYPTRLSSTMDSQRRCTGCSASRGTTCCCAGQPTRGRPTSLGRGGHRHPPSRAGSGGVQLLGVLRTTELVTVGLRHWAA